MSRAVLAALLLVLGAHGADARTWHVRKDGTGDYTVIQDAVDRAAAGDTIRIGPGRFEEKRPFSSFPVGSAEKWTFDVFVAVTVSELTIIGSGADQTVVGWPTTLGGGPDQPKVICTTPLVNRLVVEDLAMENVFHGIYRTEGGTLEARRVRSRGCLAGITSSSELGTVIEDCLFEDLNHGVVSWDPARDLLVSRCEFRACRATFVRTAGVTVTDCSFDRSVVGCQFESSSTGSVLNSTFTDQTNVGLNVITGSAVTLIGNRISGSGINLRLRAGAAVMGWDNVLSGGWWATIHSSRGVMELHGCHVLNAGGPTILLDTYLNPPLQTFDLTNNYWGTDSSATIAGWIIDNHDDLGVYAKVLYEPFLGQPVPTESTTWGDLKAGFR